MRNFYTYIIVKMNGQFLGHRSCCQVDFEAAGVSTGVQAAKLYGKTFMDLEDEDDLEPLNLVSCVFTLTGPGAHCRECKTGVFRCEDCGDFYWRIKKKGVCPECQPGGT